MPLPPVDPLHHPHESPDEEGSPRVARVLSAREAIRNACYDYESVLSVVTTRVIEQLA